ncbi:MAG: aromatic ring-hydroxylating dioxygenase subunit alpha [Pseudomonadota bacterium]
MSDGRVFATDGTSAPAVDEGLQPGNGYQLPAAAYFEQDWFRREQRQLFRRSWNFVCETRDLASPGAFVTADVGGSPVVVVRGEDQVLRAFHNVCRHRGARLLDERGQCSALICPYHRWQYGLDGQLTNVPQQAEQLPLLDRDRWGLLPVAVAEWLGLVFVNPDGAAPAFETWIAGMPTFVADYEPARLEVLTEGVFEFAANWKFYVENHVDWYHLWYTHPQTLRMWDHHEGQMHQTGAHWVSFEPPRSGHPAMTPELLPIAGLQERQRQNGAHLLFPNLTLFTGATYFATGLVTPLAPDRTQMRFRALIEPGQTKTPELAQNMLRAFQEITEIEDAGMTERLQAAVQSDAFAVGPMTLGHEAPIARFHDEYLAVFNR